MTFSREFNFADCQFLAFRGNKFSLIGYQTPPLGTNTGIPGGATAAFSICLLFLYFASGHMGLKQHTMSDTTTANTTAPDTIQATRSTLKIKKTENRIRNKNSNGC